MKKYILLGLLCVCSYTASRAQIYVKGYAGYALSTGNARIQRSAIFSDRHYAFSHLLNFGQGVNLGLGIGYTLNKNIAFEITGNTQLFSKSNYTPYEWEPGENRWGQYFAVWNYEDRIFQLSPQIVFKSNPCKRWIFYLKGGPDFIRLTRITTTPSITKKYWGTINSGIQCSFGTEYKLSKAIGVFAELTTVNVNYRFKHVKIIRCEDWIDIPTLEAEESKILQKYKPTIFDHAGLNIGLKYNF